mmetsp:Transcript_77826/g.117084  ORF Transcript_77826/g.117084 Transcript_77826/m.117084 type:complete len:204 (+) Transcript_77826:7375-7986(+)
MPAALRLFLERTQQVLSHVRGKKNSESSPFFLGPLVLQDQPLLTLQSIQQVLQVNTILQGVFPIQKAEMFDIHVILHASGFVNQFHVFGIGGEHLVRKNQLQTSEAQTMVGLSLESLKDGRHVRICRWCSDVLEDAEPGHEAGSLVDQQKQLGTLHAAPGHQHFESRMRQQVCFGQHKNVGFWQVWLCIKPRKTARGTLQCRL